MIVSCAHEWLRFCDILNLFVLLQSFLQSFASPLSCRFFHGLVFMSFLAFWSVFLSWQEYDAAGLLLFYGKSWFPWGELHVLI